MTIAGTPVQDSWTACGCGEQHIPGLLAKVGLLGTAGLALAALLVMIATGWLLVAVTSLVRRWRHPDPGRDEPAGSGLAAFTWTAEEPAPPPGG